MRGSSIVGEEPEDSVGILEFILEDLHLDEENVEFLQDPK